MEAREIFDAAPLTVGQFLSETGQGLYIPPYQRAFSWERAKIERLIADVVHGLDQITRMDDSICFLGTVIALRDLEYSTVEPIHRPSVPPKVMTIIDGQQRLTTLLLLSTALHEEIRIRAERLPANLGEVRDWCRDQAVDITSQLEDTFQEDMRYGEGPYRYYPRMVRAYYDRWARQKENAKYTSPIGYYLFRYSAYAREGAADKPYAHEPYSGEVADSNFEAHKSLEANRALVIRTLRALVDPKKPTDDEIELPSGAVIVESEILQDSLFNSAFPDYARSAIADNERVCALMRLVVFANYLLKRVTVAVVTAKREDYGFDMFEALNTTGQPLTAIETFKPKAINTEGLKEWNGSPSYGSFEIIEQYLDREGSASAARRQIATNTVLIPFALMNNATRLSKRLSDQRRYLQTTFEKIPEEDKAARREYLSALAQVTTFVSSMWGSPGALPDCPDAALRQEAQLCLQVLHDGKHDVVIAPLARYFAAYRLRKDQDSDAPVRQFYGAIRACGAFYALWRGAHGATNGIDDVYRKIMAAELGPDQPRFARHLQPLTEVPDLAHFQRLLRDRLEATGLHTKDAWVSRAAETAVYKAALPLTRLLLMAAANNSVADDEQPGLIKRGKPGTLELLSAERWNHSAFKTIEHIAPQAGGAPAWEAKLYESASTVHKLGNLTLLPSVENSSASDHAWDVKRLMYEALSATTVEQAEAAIAAAAASGVVLGKGAEAIVTNAHYLPLVTALARHTEPWTEEFVRTRSLRLCELAWDSLAPWLELD